MFYPHPLPPPHGRGKYTGAGAPATLLGALPQTPFIRFKMASLSLNRKINLLFRLDGNISLNIAKTGGERCHFTKKYPPR